MPFEAAKKIWMDGKLVDWDDAKIHILTHTLHYGCGVFEGIRAYETADGPAVFRLTDHIVRMFKSAKIYLIDIPFTLEQLVEATKETVRVNELPSCYIRPLAIYGYSKRCVSADTDAQRVAEHQQFVTLPLVPNRLNSHGG